MRVPFFGVMPKGGLRPYGGEPHFGVWNDEDNRFTLQFRGKTYKIARLICEAFHGPAPAGKPVCMHLDENSQNNRPGNLAWGTQKENLNAPLYKARTSLERTGRPRATLTPQQRDELIARAANGEPKSHLAKEYGVAPCTVSNLTRAAA